MKEKRAHSEAMAAARDLIGEIEEHCERIEVAGSLRRAKPLVGDIELVAIARPWLNLLGEPCSDNCLDLWAYSSMLTFSKNGNKYKQFAWVHEGNEYQIDLFVAMPDNWGLIQMIRTGSADFSKRMMTKRSWGGWLPDDLRVKEGKVWRNGKAVAVPTENELFALWGLEPVAPDAR